MMRKDSDNELENAFQSEDALDHVDDLISDIEETIAAPADPADDLDTLEPEGPIALPDDDQDEE